MLESLTKRGTQGLCARIALFNKDNLGGEESEWLWKRVEKMGEREALKELYAQRDKKVTVVYNKNGKPKRDIQDPMRDTRLAMLIGWLSQKDEPDDMFRDLI